VHLARVRVVRAGTFGIQVQAAGNAILVGFRAERLGAAGVYVCPSATRFRLTGTATGLERRYCGPFPKPSRS
jgi:hypothetical protein